MKHLFNSADRVSLTWLSMGSLLTVVVLAGCSSSTRITPPHIDAGNAAAEAMEQYDSDSDGFINEDELAQAPALKAAIVTLDTDNDGKVSEDEIAARIRSWQATKAAVSVIQCFVRMDGQPLDGANIVFEPEAFLGDAMRSAVAYTDSQGAFSPSVPKKDRISPDMPYGLQFGFYKILVSKESGGKETVPAIYNTETTLGQQIANDDPAVIRQRIVLELKRR